MEIPVFVVIITNLLNNVPVEAQIPEVEQKSIQNNPELCNDFAKDPYFEAELVVGKPWRVYHTWHMSMGTTCLDMDFRNATPQIIHRIWSDMYDYVEQQPYWDSAALLLTVGAHRQELLLFPAQGVAGGFTAVPNVIRSGDIPPMKKGVTLLKFQLKLVRHGKFLVVITCPAGLTSLAARADRPPHRSEIAAAVAELNLGDGFPACIQEKNKDEEMFVK